MNRISIIAAAVAASFIISGCSQEPASTQQQTQTEENAQTVATETEQAVTETVAMAKGTESGIDMENFDPTVRAQDSFYHHINGTWIKNTPIPAERSNYGSFTKLLDESQLAIRTIIEAAAANENAAPGSEEKMLGDFYRAWMDQETTNKLGVTPLKAKFAEIAAISNKQELAAAMGSMLVNGVSMPFGFFVNPDAKNSSEYGVYLYQSGLSLPDRDYYLNDDEKFVTIRAQYQKYIADLMALAGYENGGGIAGNVMAIERAIAELQWSRVERRDANKTYNKRSAEEVSAMLAGFDWQAFAKASGVARSEQFIVRELGYFEKFATLFATQDIAVWQDYLRFHLLNDYAEYLSDDMVALKFGFFGKTLSGVEEQMPRWKQAVQGADNVIGELVGKLYVEQNFKPEAKARMEQLVDNLIEAFAVSIDELDWMSEETKVQAKIKLSKFTPKIGYPDEWRDYSKLTIKSDDLAGNYMRYAQFEYSDMLSKLGKPIDRNEWHMTPQTVNAYYNPVMNEIVFPAAILQPPFFNMDADDAVNYGGIGAVIGHELGHGFDDQGAKYDGDGNLRNWWTDADLAEFQKRGKKLVEQYNSYAPFPDANVNGELTLGENLGDLGGLSVAYKAYQMSLNGEPEPEIDGFTGTQRFFTGWAQVWRRNYRDEELRRRLMTDSHSPSQYRVDGIVPHLPAFYQAFSVSEEDQMYIAPENRVKIW